MRFPWSKQVSTDEELERDERRFEEVRAHLRVLVRELQLVTVKVEDKARRMADER